MEDNVEAMIGAEDETGAPEHIYFTPYDTTTYKLFEYMVFYPYYHILHTVIKAKNSDRFVFPNKEGLDTTKTI